MAALQCSVKYVVFSSETGHWRKARQRKHEERQETGQQRLTIPQAAYIGQITATIVNTFQDGDNTEGSQVHECITQQVEEDGRKPDHTTSHYAYQEVAGMRYARIGQQSFDLALYERQHISTNKGQNGDGQHDRLPI